MRFKVAGKEASSLESEQFLDVDLDRPRRIAAMPQSVPVSRHEYSLIKRARGIIADGIGTSSLMLRRGEFKYFDPEFRAFQEKYCNRAIGVSGLMDALRAWEDLMRYCIEIPGKKIEGTVIKFQPTVDFFRKYGGPYQIVDIESAEKIVECRKQILGILFEHEVDMWMGRA